MACHHTHFRKSDRQPAWLLWVHGKKADFWGRTVEPRRANTQLTWVIAEIAELNDRAAGGHVYLDLIEHNSQG
jgi:hypothetical protein